MWNQNSKRNVDLKVNTMAMDNMKKQGVTIMWRRIHKPTSLYATCHDVVTKVSPFLAIELNVACVGIIIQ
jgi:hypothetical protein